MQDPTLLTPTFFWYKYQDFKCKALPLINLGYVYKRFVNLLIQYVLRYDLIDRPGVLGNYVPVNYHSLYDLSVLEEGSWLGLEHPKVCIICGAVETASSTQKRWDISCPEYTSDWYEYLHEASSA